MSRKLMLIDDDAGIGRVVARLATQRGLEIRVVNDSLQALEQYIDFRPDIVIIDMIMPGKDGIEVLHELLSSGIPSKVVLASGYSTAYLRLAQGVARFHDADAPIVLSKPFRRHELIELMDVRVRVAGC